MRCLVAVILLPLLRLPLRRRLRLLLLGPVQRLLLVLLPQLPLLVPQLLVPLLRATLRMHQVLDQLLLALGVQAAVAARTGA